MSLITEIRALNKVEEFEEGGEAVRTKLNGVVAFINGLKDAADRAKDGNGDGVEKTYRVIEDGVGVLRTFLTK